MFRLVLLVIVASPRSSDPPAVLPSSPRLLRRPARVPVAPARRLRALLATSADRQRRHTSATDAFVGAHRSHRLAEVLVVLVEDAHEAQHQFVADLASHRQVEHVIWLRRARRNRLALAVVGTLDDQVPLAQLSLTQRTLLEYPPFLRRFQPNLAASSPRCLANLNLHCCNTSTRRMMQKGHYYVIARVREGVCAGGRRLQLRESVRACRRVYGRTGMRTGVRAYGRTGMQTTHNSPYAFDLSSATNFIDRCETDSARN